MLSFLMREWVFVTREPSLALLVPLPREPQPLLRVVQSVKLTSGRYLANL